MTTAAGEFVWCRGLRLQSGDNRIFVAGQGTDDIGIQSGGQTTTLQGATGPVTACMTIHQGIGASAEPSSTVTYSADGTGIDSTYRRPLRPPARIRPETARPRLPQRPARVLAAGPEGAGVSDIPFGT
ncbi:hypothetical protein [Kitasatospora sp. Root107]|uniref:hypothetical protein n=1 Tax=Kitasatospora sp. Root107 TaxID=1736424 RepID=UPI000710DF2C|nr:hypothetical protein [Kitasatospora sp. Root107]KQV16664.1 hypothetical protein ASC99_28285 [Kitasatospora sp. Root107]